MRMSHFSSAVLEETSRCRAHLSVCMDDLVKAKCSIMQLHMPAVMGRSRSASREAIVDTPRMYHGTAHGEINNVLHRGEGPGPVCNARANRVCFFIVRAVPAVTTMRAPRPR